ncbi:hypothetical protein G3570_07720 [Balneolaceae bacterium YR4-1]|uniref:Uncharacterized protein n=1 Tax=Halalkalibaculum roseum TaxID=2709311 RepID=A0A6M1SWZ2_9BACT|nr:hypothetical protein [Halalkalibaculum roseum]NGP76516.1 hypothetical protein [Halalkalibaculum roseum]
MKTTTNYIILLIVGAILTGCGIPSVHPLYEPQDLIVNDDITGVWSSEDELFYVFSLNDLENNRVNLPENIVTSTNDSTSSFSLNLDEIEDDLVEKKDEGIKNLYYIIHVVDDVILDLYFAGLVQLDSQYFIDFYKVSYIDDAFRFPTHLFTKLEIFDDKLVLQEFKESFVRELIENQQIRIKHEYADDNLLLTAPSVDLKKFILKYGREEAAYGDKYTYNRVKNTL